MAKRRKAMTPGAKIGMSILAVLQIAFAAAAFWDLSKRSPNELNGSKAGWAPALLINWFGPAAYFLFGIRRG